jgi:hypothetical protein
MEYMPNYFPVVRDNGVNPCQEAPSAEKDIIAFNTQIFDALGTLDHLNEAAWVVKFKELCASLQPVACQSALHFKHAAAAIIGCTNQLSSMQKGNTGAIRISAIEKSRGRKAKDIFDNKSALRPSKKVKGDTIMMLRTVGCPKLLSHLSLLLVLARQTAPLAVTFFKRRVKCTLRPQKWIFKMPAQVP